MAMSFKVTDDVMEALAASPDPATLSCSWDNRLGGGRLIVRRMTRCCPHPSPFTQRHKFDEEQEQSLSKLSTQTNKHKQSYPYLGIVSLCPYSKRSGVVQTGCLQAIIRLAHVRHSLPSWRAPEKSTVVKKSPLLTSRATVSV